MSRLGSLMRRFSPPDLADAPPVEPAFHTRNEAIDAEVVRLRLRRPIVAGSIVVLVLVFGLLIWATFASIAGAVVAPGVVRVENNVKQIKQRDGGIVRAILVREGQRVRRGQVLMRFDRVQSGAGVDILQAGYDSALAQVARFQAEAANADTVHFPHELVSRAGDPRVATLLSSQQALFGARMTLYRSQAAVLRGQVDQLGTQIQGLQAQRVATDAQSGLIDDELGGVRDLNRLGYAPRSRLLALQRSAAQLTGQRGSLLSDIARATQSIGDVRIQIAQLDDKRQTDAAEGLRDAQDKLTELVPKLTATRESLNQTDVRAPVDGYVLNLTQSTEGGVAQPGEPLMEIVPVNVPLIITAMVRPNDIAEIRSGLPARVTLTAFNPRTTPPVDARVSVVSADATEDPASHATYYKVEVRVAPAELAKAGHDVHLTPGMPATVSIVTGSRTVMDYLLGPMTEAMRTAMREK